MIDKILPPQQQKKAITIIGGAVGDIVLTIDKLPYSGQDIAANLQGQQIGGCALNIARVLRRLGCNIINGIPVGNGSWGQRIEQEMQSLAIPVLLRHFQQDNGWCMALVEPNGERTFISVDGCETDWDNLTLTNLPQVNESIVYASGYELSGTTNGALQDWLLALPKETVRFIDPGPRLASIDKTFFEQLLNQNTILTLNRDEIEWLCGKSDDPVMQVQQFLQRYPITVIVRLDSQGAWLCQAGKTPHFVSAYQVDVVDSIGAGDSHCGGVIAGLAWGFSLVDAIELGNRIAAMVVNRRGADNPPTLAELGAFQFVKKDMS